MAQVLSQDEVDALLNAVNDGDVDEMMDTDGADFSLGLELIEGFEDLFHRDGHMSERAGRPMDLKKIDIISLQVFQGTLANADDLIVFEVVGKDFGGDYRFVTDTLQRFPENPFGMAVSIDLCGIEGRDTCIESSPDGFPAFVVVYIGPHGLARLPGSHDNGCNFYIRGAQRPQFHRPLLIVNRLTIQAINFSPTLDSPPLQGFSI